MSRGAPRFSDESLSQDAVPSFHFLLLGTTVIKAANDNKPTRHISSPFHRIYSEGWLHRHPKTAYALYLVGCRYEKSFSLAGGSGIQSPNYERPLVDGGGYDPYRDTAIPRHLDKQRLYSDAAQVLDIVEARGLVEDIIIQGMPLVEAGRKHTGRKHEAQARAAAVAMLTTSLLLLRDHYTQNAERDAA